MADPGLIAYLYPGGSKSYRIENAIRAISMAENAARYLKPLAQDRSPGPSQEPGSSPYHSDEGEGEGEDEGEDVGGDGNDWELGQSRGTPDNNDYSPALQLRFDDWRKNSVGLVFGTSRNADIVLPKRNTLAGLASRQCVLTFDELGRLIVRDIQERGRKGGTAVTYSKKGDQRRRQFTWILSGHRFPEDNQPIILSLHDNLKFQVVVAPHDISSPAYQANVALFRQRVSADAGDLSLGGLGFQSLPSSASSSGLQTPQTPLTPGGSVMPMLLHSGILGQGAQALVSRVWDVSSGLEYASKESLARKYDKQLKAEIALLRQLGHPHIIRRVWSSETPSPRLILEFMPLGALDAQHEQDRLSVGESLDVLRQGLLALRYLHERDEPIVHRDIKPGNILVQSRAPLHIKLSDFGLSKVTHDYLMTYCGTRLYTAPELFQRKPYDASVDVWSLGLVVWELTYGLPETDRKRTFDGVRWTKTIIRTLRADIQASPAHCPLLALLASSMLVWDPNSRSSARRCYGEASRLDASQCCGLAMPTPAGPAYGCDGDGDDDARRTAIYEPGQPVVVDSTVHPSNHTYSTARLSPEPQSVLPSGSLSEAAAASLTRASRATRSSSARPAGAEYEEQTDVLRPLEDGSSFVGGLGSAQADAAWMIRPAPAPLSAHVPRSWHTEEDADRQPEQHVLDSHVYGQPDFTGAEGGLLAADCNVQGESWTASEAEMAELLWQAIQHD